MKQDSNIKQQFQENSREPVKINFQDAYMAIGRLGWGPMSDVEKKKNKFDPNGAYYKAKHELEIIRSELTDPEAYKFLKQLSPETVLTVLAKHAFHEMKEIDGYYEDSLYPRKLDKKESVLYENIFNNGVVILPIEQQKSVIYNWKNVKHDTLIKDGEDYVAACQMAINDRKAWLKKNMEQLQFSQGESQQNNQKQPGPL